MAFLNISTKNKKGVLADVDRQDYFRLGNVNSSRLTLYNFVFALGYNNGLPSDLDAPKESFIREEYVKDLPKRFTYSAAYFATHEKECMDDIEKLTNTDIVFPLIDKYANTGFSVLSDLMKKYDDLALALKLIGDMDEMNAEFLADFGEQ